MKSKGLEITTVNDCNGGGGVDVFERQNKGYLCVP